MKTIGLLGGMSWESTQTYYRLINEGIKDKLGGLHSAKIILYSVDFAEIERLQHQDDWQGAANLLYEAADSVQRAGADFLVICTNTMHKVADVITPRLRIPLLHIADATADKLTEQGIKTVGLLGTRFTMEQDFYSGRIGKKHGIEVVIPNQQQRDYVHNVIYQELCLGLLSDSSRKEFINIIDSLIDSGAEAVILGCTEISLLVKPENTPTLLFDTTYIHAQRTIEWSLDR